MVIKVIKNILFSGLEQFVLIVSQFLSSIIIIRTLPREQYGLIGVVAGYFVFFNLVNISIESILLRDHLKYEGKIKTTLENICSINIVKLGLIFILSVILSFFLFYFFNSINALYAVGISYVALSSQAFVSPFIVYYGTKFKQKIITKVSVARILMRILCLLGLFYLPTISYFFFVEFFIAFCFCMLWIIIVRKSEKISLANIFFFKRVDWVFVKASILEYSAWTHLTGVVTNFIYKSDTFFLSFFVGLPVIGNYNIALNSSNLANVLPSILGYQNSIALSNTENREEVEKSTNSFISASFYLGIVTLACFVIFGEFYLKIITGEEIIESTYYYMISIVSSLILIKTFSSPLISLVNIKGNVKNLFFRVAIPLFFVVVITYSLSAYYFGAMGIAIANFLNAIIWLLLLRRELNRYDFNYSLKINPIKDLKKLKISILNIL